MCDYNMRERGTGEGWRVGRGIMELNMYNKVNCKHYGHAYFEGLMSDRTGYQTSVMRNSWIGEVDTL